jgi:hypothetical protein
VKNYHVLLDEINSHLNSSALFCSLELKQILTTFH